MRLTVCQDHLELAVDIVVDETGEAPDLLTLREAERAFVGWAVPARCDRCEQKPVAVVCPCGGGG